MACCALADSAAFDPLLSLPEVASLHPEPAQRGREFQALPATFRRRQTPLQRQPQVVVLPLQSISQATCAARVSSGSARRTSS